MLGSLGVLGRPKDDFYETPEIATEKLLDVEEFLGSIWEPACGAGGIARVLRCKGYNVVATDLYPHGFGRSLPLDFLSIKFQDAHRIRFDNIITNPPYSLALEFAEQATSLARLRRGKVAMLLRLAWLEGKKRKDFFKMSRLARVWVFSSRLPRMHRPGWKGKKSSSMIAFAWFVWDYSRRTRRTRIGWL
jgi:hypothetical protein